MNSTTSSIVAVNIIPDHENDQVFIFQQNGVQQVVHIDEDELNIELGLDFGDYYDTDYDEDEEVYEEDYEDDEDEDGIIQQVEAAGVDRCPAA